MKLEVKNTEYYQLQRDKEIILFDDFKQAVQEMKEAIKKNPGKVRLWKVKQEKEKWAMTEVSYKELFEILVKEG